MKHSGRIIMSAKKNCFEAFLYFQVFKIIISEQIRFKMIAFINRGVSIKRIILLYMISSHLYYIIHIIIRNTFHGSFCHRIFFPELRDEYILCVLYNSNTILHLTQSFVIVEKQGYNIAIVLFTLVNDLNSSR